MGLPGYLIFDAALIVVCAAVLATRPNFRHSHPVGLYLLFHVLIFTTRAWSLEVSGSSPLLPLLGGEIERSLFVSDVLLAVMTAASVSTSTGNENRIESPRPLRPSIVNGVALLAFPIGAYFLFARTSLGGAPSAVNGYESSYQTLAVTWPGLFFILWIYTYGFRIYLVFPMVAYLTIMALQGESRFRLLLPAIFVLQIYLDRKGLRFPNVRTMAAIIGLALLFVPLDAIGNAYQQGTLSTSTLREALADSQEQISSGESSDQKVFDQYALSLRGSDILGEPQLGRHFLDLLALPIPRSVWPEKPATNEHLISISGPGLPLAEIGAVFTLPGELYTDWRWPGLLVGGFLLAKLLLRFFVGAYSRGYGSLAHFSYLVIASSLIQIYRDGLASVVVFLLVQSAPMIVIIVLHFVVSGHNQKDRFRPLSRWEAAP